MKVVIINYGAGNITSLSFALKRLGITDVVSSNNPEEILRADRVFFPGVGHAAYAMDRLKQHDLDQLIPGLKQPVLGICLGMQLMCAHSKEGNTQGLGIFGNSVKRFGQELKVPQMGWNAVRQSADLPEQDWFYFVHSYYAEIGVSTEAIAQYGDQKFSAVLRKDNFLACQFHPEKSGDAGKMFLKKFLNYD